MQERGDIERSASSKAGSRLNRDGIHITMEEVGKLPGLRAVENPRRDRREICRSTQSYSK